MKYAIFFDTSPPLSVKCVHYSSPCLPGCVRRIWKAPKEARLSLFFIPLGISRCSQIQSCDKDWSWAWKSVRREETKTANWLPHKNRSKFCQLFRLTRPLCNYGRGKTENEEKDWARSTPRWRLQSPVGPPRGTPGFGYMVHPPRFCPCKVDHIAKMTIYPKNLVLKYDWPLTI